MGNGLVVKGHYVKIDENMVELLSQKTWLMKLERGRLIYLGLYHDIADAKKAYWDAAIKFRGEFARAA